MLFNKRKRDWKATLVPLSLAAGIIIADQAAKISALSKLTPGQPVSVIDNLLRFVLVQNPAIAWSIGHGLPTDTRRVVFLILPLVVMALLLVYYLLSRDPFTRLQRWCFGALLGGGLGNYVDRIFRPAGVVDFIQMKVFGLFGMQYWPVYNVADATVVIAGIILFISFLLPQRTQASETPGAPEGKP
jgi:signal peptidase II